MWTCQNCENQNEDNYKFCWSCGQPAQSGTVKNKAMDTAFSFNRQSADEPEKNIPQVKAFEKENESPTEAEKAEKPQSPEKFEESEPEIIIIEPTEPTTESRTEPKTSDSNESKTIHIKVPEPELFETFLPESERRNVSTDAETDWETVIFRTAVRLVGLYFIFLVLTSIPELAAGFYALLLGQNPEVAALSDFFSTSLFYFTLRILFYLVVGVYLIANGGILLWFFPRR